MSGWQGCPVAWDFRDLCGTALQGKAILAALFPEVISHKGHMGEDYFLYSHTSWRLKAVLISPCQHSYEGFARTHCNTGENPTHTVS
jgi:hypothetical protein